MPHYRWHILCAVFAFFLFFLIFMSIGIRLNPELWIFSFLACVFSSLIPDIDSKKSKIYRLTMDAIVVLGAILIVFYMFESLQAMLWVLLFWFLLSGVLHMPFRHRGLIHSMWAASIYSFVIGMLAAFATGSFMPGIFAFLGFFSHLALDKKV